MQDILRESLKRLKRRRAQRTRLITILLVLSLVVSLDVFWMMRQPGLALAGDAACGITEHSHDEACQSGEMPCEIAEHTHDVSCYSDETADVETQLDWQAMFAGYPYTGDLRKDLAGIAATQVGYTESTLNFEVDQSGIRHGYTRYGAFYGAPYAEWSAMFVSFCLHYAKADPVEYPGNMGAASMAELWKGLGKYAAAGTYTPEAGDLVFLSGNAVGIAAQVQGNAVYVIRGNADGAVRGETIALTDASILGWGKTGESEALPEETATASQRPSAAELIDITNGPAFFIFADGEKVPQMLRYSLKRTAEVTDLVEYLTETGGSYFFTLMDKDGDPLPRDENNNFIAEIGTDYKLTLSINGPNGFAPGTYQYQIPYGLQVNGGSGTFIIKDGTAGEVNVGSWEVTDDGLVTLVFNEEINKRTKITISATMGFRFPEEEGSIKFEGNVTVTIKKPQTEVLGTNLQKWGSQGVPETEKPDPTKIYWTVQIAGNRDSQIPGSVLSDQVLLYDWSYQHRYTESDIAGGITFGASVVDYESGQEASWHRWHVSADDPNLTWDENGWSYTMPETAICEFCHNELTLGNENWTYYVEYTSTPDATNVAGGLPYTNRAEIDNQTVEGWVEFAQGDIQGDVFKKGTLIATADGAEFLWEVQATIPGREDGERALRQWFINDVMSIRTQNEEIVGYITNDIDKTTVTANYHGTTINVPNIKYATENDPYAWMVAWSNADGGNGIENLRQIYIMCRCDCTAETCGLDTGCWTQDFVDDYGVWIVSDYCHCWTETENTTFTFTYRTEDVSAIVPYIGQSYFVRNDVLLAYDVDKRVADAGAKVQIPSVLSKELNRDFDGSTVNYVITLNESKLVLTDGSPLRIHDEMTDTMAYISGSLVISAEDADGNITELQQGTDYTVTYDGTGGQTDENGKKVHVLDIVILHPQPVMYVLDYDTTLIIPEQATEGIRFSNDATISLWGQEITDGSEEKVHADINIAARSYYVELMKTIEGSDVPLAGATFGLYNSHGGLIAEDVTDAEGKLSFHTDVVNGIILHDHVLYYMQELEAPQGYRLDDTKNWFCFCNTADDTCETCNEVRKETNAVRIPYEQIGIVCAENRPISYQLPATGGPGIYPLILASVIFVATPLVYTSVQRRKRERRGES